MHAVARILLDGSIPNVQVSWVKLGVDACQAILRSGANDFGGTLMEESISRESGSQHGENLPAEDMRRLIREIGRTPVERTTTYGVLRRFDDPALDPPSLEPVRDCPNAIQPWPRRVNSSRRRTISLSPSMVTKVPFALWSVRMNLSRRRSISSTRARAMPRRRTVSSVVRRAICARQPSQPPITVPTRRPSSSEP